MVDFHVPEYDGPLDLLLSLIQKNKVNIYDIPISLITDQFLAYIKEASSIGLRDLSDFYKTASDLIWIKSQMLIPKNTVKDTDFTDPREDLVERLLEYSKYKTFSESLLASRFSDSSNFPNRKPYSISIDNSETDLFNNIDIQFLRNTYIDLMQKHLNISNAVFNIWEEVTENEKKALMYELFEKNNMIEFTQLFEKNASEYHIICAFSVILEETKDKEITIDQSELFGKITVSKV